MTTTTRTTKLTMTTENGIDIHYGARWGVWVKWFNHKHDARGVFVQLDVFGKTVWFKIEAGR